MKKTADFHFIETDFAEESPKNNREALSRAAYQRAIRALDLDIDEERLFMNPDNLDRFRSQLVRRLKKTKLWNYPPEKRSTVKTARTQLQNILGVEVLY